jgi:integrase
MARIFQDTKEKRTLGSKAPWWVEWRENGRRRSQKVGSKTRAKEIAALKGGEALQRRNGLTVDKPWDDFVADYKKLVLPTMRSVLSRDSAEEVLARFGNMMKPRHVGLIDRKTLDEYAAKRLKDKGRRPGDTLSPETVRKDLRTIRAALSKAHEWHYLAAIPSMPKVQGFGSEKRFVSIEHFEALMTALETEGVVKRPRSAKAGFAPEDWWRALLVTLWVTGMRIGSVLALRWEDVDLDAGTALSRAKHNKAKKDQRIDLAPAVELLRKLKGFDPRVFPWDVDRSALYTQFERLQVAAGIHLPCTGEHEHTGRCHVYGFHDFRRAHATYNYGRVTDRELQTQMGHSTFATTQRYIKFAEQQAKKAYNAHVPASLAKVIAGSA